MNDGKIFDDMKFNSALCEKLKENIKNEFKGIVSALKSVTKGLDDSDEAALLKIYLNCFEQHISLNSQDDIFEKIMALGALESEINIFREFVKKTQTKLDSYLVSLLDDIKSRIKNLSSRLWQLLSQYLTLKEWSIAGNTNIDVLGFSGGITLQLTFKKK